MRRSVPFVASLLAAAPLLAAAASVTSVSPQGEVAQVRQVVVKFSEAVAPLGDLRQPAPFELQCQGAALPSADARWNNEREWVLAFREALPPGLRCTVAPVPGWQPLGGALANPRRYSFATGGPALLSLRPWPGSEVAEDQHFILELNGAAARASVEANAWCEVEGLGDRLPLRVLDGAPREEALAAQRVSKARAARSLVVACARPLPADVPMRLVWGAGIAAAADARSLTRVPQRHGYRVRKPFLAEFSCERERAEAACLPIRPLRLGFSAPLTREQAAQIRLRPDGGGAPLAPVFDADDRESHVRDLVFPVPLPENATFTLELPGTPVQDDAGRSLANAASFPLKVATGAAPPIAKFAAAPFGVIEFAEAQALLPLTLRHVQGDLRATAPGQVRVKRLQSAVEILTWMGRVERYHERSISAREAGRPEREWFEFEQVKDARGRLRTERRERYLQTRELPLLAGDADVRRLALPQLEGGDPRPFEVIGLPLDEPGYHVLEVESPRLGAALLDKPAPMYVRTGVLATNLGVHFKLGRENSAVWVTSLDRGRPVAGAEVAVHDCRGRALWSGRSDARGLASVPLALDEDQVRDDCLAEPGLFVTARAVDAKGRADLAFVFSHWQKGIEPWRYNHPIASGPEPDRRAHTVFDRTLLRAGETVSMKHFLRAETGAGLADLPAAELPTRLVITHQGSGEEVELPLAWERGRSALSAWAIPKAAKLGRYEVRLERPDADDERRVNRWTSGYFRVEAFRVPLVDARLAPPATVPAAPRELALALQLTHLSGGGVAQAPVRASALLRDRVPAFAGYEDYRFAPPRAAASDDATSETDDEADATPAAAGRLVADRLPLQTDANGAATVTLKDLPPVTRAGELLVEAGFDDPNGEQQTVATRVALWPSEVVLGVRATSWASRQGQVDFGVVALDTAGRPRADQAVEVRGRLARTLSSRKRLVGGFYAYDNRTEYVDLGVLCSGRSDARGRLACSATLAQAGEVELIARATDAAGRAVEAASSVWVTRHGELWFAQDNDDRMDVLAERRRVEPGEIAKLQVRMPFREATALVTVEREGLLHSEVQRLRGDDPTVTLKIDPAWGPNVYVSVLALRGRLREVPWYSFFQWGWKAPVEWWNAWRHEGPEHVPPTAMVDLSRPAFKLGVTVLEVGTAAHRLDVKVSADKPQYQVREKAQVRLQVRRPDGQPAAGAEVAFAAVDEGLLALAPNDSWDLLTGLLQPRPWGVATSTAQGEIVGRRHYGRKAVAAGGGGGGSAARELFDTLLLWRGRVVLDARGEAVVEVPLNDSLTSFRFVAVADAEGQRFGSGSASVRVSQDLQLLPGLPALVREGDHYEALLTLRNTTARAMSVEATLKGEARIEGGAPRAIALEPRRVELAPGAAQALRWPVEVPEGASQIAWDAEVRQQGGTAADRVKLTQAVSAAVPSRVLQATLSQLDAPYQLPVAAPADALAGADGVARGGLTLALQPRLGAALPGLKRYFETYPYTCLEQQASRAIGLGDAARWAAVAEMLPTYLDADGLAGYFPPGAGDAAQGSDRLTAYLLAVAHEAGRAWPAAARDRMLDGLTAFVEGRIERRFWAPRADGDVRRLAAIEALSRHGRARAAMLDTLQIAPNRWPSAALIDWIAVLRRLPDAPDHARRLEEAQQILRARLSYSGTTLQFSTETEDAWWWLMDGPDANAARAILALLDEPGWKDELPRLVIGALGRQRGGAWQTTVANAWGVLALEKFSARFESAPVTGQTQAANGRGSASLDWAARPDGGTLMLPWPAAPGGSGTLTVTHEGSGRPWLATQAVAALPLKAPLVAGYRVTRRVAAVQRQDPARWSRGDVLRITLEVEAEADMSWVVVSDPVPGGATLLGSGLGRDSAIATAGERRGGDAWPTFEERGTEAFRAYYAFLPRGRHRIEYTLRLNHAGRYALPPSRVEAMYAPERFGEAPNETLVVVP